VERAPPGRRALAGTVLAMAGDMPARLRRLLPALLLAVGCHSTSTQSGDAEVPDLSAPDDAAHPEPSDDLGGAAHDGGTRPDGFIGQLPDGGPFIPPSGAPPVVHGPPGRLPGLIVLGAGTDFRDVSTDQGGGVWAVDGARVYYFRGG